MALFQKKLCSVCSKPISTFATSHPICGGSICEECWARCSPLAQLSNMSPQDILKHIELRCEQPEWVESTDTVKNYLCVDRKRQLWYSPFVCISGDEDVFHFSQLIGFDLVEDGTSITEGGLGSALVGGALLGGTGAIIGASLGRKQKSICGQLSVIITVDDPYISFFSIDLVKSEMRLNKNSDLYQKAKKDLHSIAALLTMILKQRQVSAPPAPQTQSVSAADEILKFKQLADAGILTQEEFEAKKKQLLGL